MLDLIFLYSNPSTLFGVLFAVGGLFIIRLATATGNNYSDIAEQYYLNNEATES